MMLKLFLILALCVAINHGLKCLVCTVKSDGEDCDKNPAKFSKDCAENEICTRKGKGAEFERSCGQESEGGAAKGRCEYTSCCSTDNCNTDPGQGGGGDNNDGDKGGPGGGSPGSPGSPSGPGSPGGGNPDDTGSGASKIYGREKFNLCVIFAISLFYTFFY